MTVSEETLENKAITSHVPPEAWSERTGFRIDLAITRDDEGLYSAVALNLPGAGSSGATEEEAIENAKEAIAGVIESYGVEEIPWKEVSAADVPGGATRKRILVKA